MDINNLKGLVEAYSEVYASQEVDEATAMAKRGYDEAPIRQKIAKSTGGGEAADRASALEKKSTFGDAKKAKQRQDLARKQRGDFRKTTSSSPGLHGYAHKSDDPAVKTKQAARGAQRGALTPAEKKQFNREEFDVFDVVLEFLQVEGYAENLEEAEWMMANLIDEEAIDIILEAMCDDEEDLDEALTGDRAKKAVKKPGGTAYTRMVSADPAKRAKRGGRGGESDFGAGDRGSGNKAARRAGTYQEDFEAWLDEALTGERYKKALKKGKQYSRMHSADPEKRPTRGGRGGKQSDFGSPDRGGGHKSMRRRGMEVLQGDD